jgi:hypothetical protein
VADRWRIEKERESVDRRVLVGIFGLAFGGVGLWSLAQSAQQEAFGAIVASCAGIAAFLLVLEKLGLIGLGAPTLQEITLSTRRVTLTAGYLRQSVEIASVVRIEVRTHPQVRPLLVLVSSTHQSCAIPRAAWEALDIRQRLGRLSGLDEEALRRALASNRAQVVTLWEGDAGQAVAFTAPDRSRVPPD